MKKLIAILPLFASLLVFGQGRLVLNNDGYVVIDNAAFVVLENPNPNAITTLGTGGNIVSEAEVDVIHWEIGTTTGTYTIPWTTSSGTKIPLVINKTSAGTGATAEFVLSTWECATDFNTPIPSGVNNMNFNAVDRSLFVADRFWHINALSYAAKPNVTLTISYDPAANEIGGANTITETNLLAQRFNTGLNHWESQNLYGTNDAGNDRVTNIAITAADFFEDWILVDRTNPLPVTLASFEATCQGDHTELTWVTEAEINNDYFIVEKSYDGAIFFELATIPGQGVSNVPTSYSYTDVDVYNGTAYYRLKQVDFDATPTFHKIIASNCEANGFEVRNLTLNNGSLTFNLELLEQENLTLYFYDYRGRLLFSEVLNATEGVTNHTFNNLDLSSGIYMFTLQGERNNYSVKLMNNQ